MPFHAQFTRDEVNRREGLIIKYIVSLIKDTQQMPDIIPYFLNYGIIDWSWPLRFVKGNHPYKGYRYYSDEAHNAVLRGQIQFKRDHILPKKLLKEMLFSIINPDADNVRLLMERYGEICVVTREEDLKLNDAGLRSNMPQGWQMTNGDVLARYHAVDIQVWTNDLLW